MNLKKLKFWESSDTQKPVADSQKFCRNCQFFVSKTGYCDNPKTLHISLVTGKPIREVECNVLRTNSMLCGPDAVWFVNKE